MSKELFKTIITLEDEKEKAIIRKEIFKTFLVLKDEKAIIASREWASLKDSLVSDKFLSKTIAYFLFNFIEHGYNLLAQLILDVKASPLLVDDFWGTFDGVTLNIFHWAAEYSTSIATLKKIHTTNPSLIIYKDSEGFLPLHIAAAIGNLSAVLFLTNLGNYPKKDISLYIDSNDNEEQITPLMLAVMNASEGVVRAILKAGADVNIADICGDTALHYAAIYNKPNIWKILKEYGASSEIKNYYDLYPYNFICEDSISDFITADLALVGERDACPELYHF